MDNSVKIALIVVFGVVFLGLVGITFVNSVLPDQETLSVNGQGTVDAMPDLVSVYLNVETTGKTSDEATANNAEIVDDVVAAIMDVGFNREEIQTLNFNVYENCEWKSSGRVCDGYKAVHSVKVEMSTEETGKIGKVIDSGAGAGAIVSYVNFELSPELQNEYKAKAMKLAAEDARVKAEAVAEGLDKDVGKIVSVSIDNWGYSPWLAYDFAESDVAGAKAAATNIQPSEQSISATVNVKFKFR